MSLIHNRDEKLTAMPTIQDYAGYLITWTTYGTWLPGDRRGWRKRGFASQLHRPSLERWCRQRMAGDVVLLSADDRRTVEQACQEHCIFRGWELKTVNARTNHVHVVVVAKQGPAAVRDQLKANCTRRLRTKSNPLLRERTWSRGGDCIVLANDRELVAAMEYVHEGQDGSRF